MKIRRFKKEVKISFFAIITILFLCYYAWYISDLKARRDLFETVVINTQAYESIEKEPLECPTQDEFETTDVYFTNYHYGDGSSGDTTASGLQIKDFEVNDEGMYTYDGKVVIATANMIRFPRGIVEGYNSHELFEEFTIRLNDKEYPAIVLDVCGACYGMFDEFLQRYDIFATKNVVGKVIGQVLINKTGQ